MGLHRRYEGLLDGWRPQLTLDKSLRDKIHERLSKAFEGMMRAVFHQQGAQLDISIVASDEAQNFINAHAQTLDSSFTKVPMSDAMRRRLERSDYIFSGMKAFHEMNEAFPSLLDENGERKPFEQFLQDVQKIDSTYNRHYLEAEYNFVQASAEMAGKWEQYAADGDRYNLQYRTAGDDKVRPSHQMLDGVTLPMNDTFWETYYPPNGWGCRCTVVQVRKSKFAPTEHDAAMSLGEGALQEDKKGFFHFNSGIQQKAMPDYNPYTIRRCNDCDVAKGKTKLAWTPENELCQACRLIHQAQTARNNQRLLPDELRTATAKVKEWIDNNLPTIEINGVPSKKEYLKTKDGHKVGISSRFFNETISKNRRNPQMVHTLKMATEFRKWLPAATKTDEERGRHHPCDFYVYTVEYQGHTIQFKTKVGDEELLYIMRLI